MGREGHALESGTWPPGLPYIRMGAGRPLLFMPGITGHHRLPRGTELTFQTRPLRPFAEAREVWWVNRRAGLPRGVTMAGIAEDYVDVIRSRLGAPTDVFAMSTGASVALALAVEHPDLVRRLVVQGATGSATTAVASSGTWPASCGPVVRAAPVPSSPRASRREPCPAGSCVRWDGSPAARCMEGNAPTCWR